MSKRLIIAEKPSVARDIAKVVGSKTKGEGFIEGDRFIVTWAYGHLVTLAEPDEYSPVYKKWSMDSLPIVPTAFKTKIAPVKGARAQFTIIKKLMNRKDIDELIVATDAGREGELIFRYIYELAGCTKPFKRLWISSLTDESIQHGLKNLLPGDAKNGLADAGKSRSEADWVIGMTGTRGYTIQFGGFRNVLSIGRVQTPTLAMIVKREKDIRSFIPEDYWELVATFLVENGETYKGKWQKGKQNRFSTEQAAQEIAEKVNGKTGRITKADKKETQQYAPLLFDLTELQKEMNKRYGFTSDRTLKVAQSLYEKKLLTYPRTSSRYLSTDMYSQINKHLNACSFGENEPFASELLAANKLPFSKRIFDNAKVTDHHAIIPTTKNAATAKLTADETKLYDRVAKRFIAIFYPAAIYEQTSIMTEVEAETFHTSGKILISPGWLKVYGNRGEDQDDDDKQLLPIVKLMDEVFTRNTQIEKKQTKPPLPYTEATLLDMMKTAGKLIDNEELSEAMKEGGLGTPATRASIIETLLDRQYIVRDKKNLIPTDKGMSLIELIGDKPITSPELTGEWEEKLSRMERGHYSREAFMAEIKVYAEKLIYDIVQTAKVSPQMKIKSGEKWNAFRKGASEASEQKTISSIGVCPICKSPVIENSKAYGCSDWKSGCKFTIWKTISGKKLTENQVVQLLTKGATTELKGFKSKNGKPFSAKLALENGKIAFQFNNKA